MQIQNEVASFQLAFELASSPMLMVDRQGEILLANTQSEILFEYEPKELLGQNISCLIPNRFKSAHKNNIAHFISQPTRRAMGAGRDLFGLKKYGNEVPVEIGLATVQAGAELLVVCSIIDITERKQNELKFKVALEAAPNAMLMVDHDGKVVLTNKQLEVLFGYTKDELLNMSIEMLIPKRYRSSHPNNIKSFLQNPSARSMGSGRDLYGLKKDGSEVPVEIGLTPVEMPDGIYIISSIIDITERKKADDELRRLLAEVQEKNSDLEKFAYVASHDLKSPLRAIDNIIGWLLEDIGDDLNEDNKKNIKMLVNRVHRMENLLDDLLEYYRASKEIKNFELVKASELIKEITHLLNIPEKMTVTVDDSMRGIVIPKMPLQQLFHNLISNAVKHHDKSTGKIIISAKEEQCFYIFSVKDDGPGIDEEFREKVFELFQTLKPRDQVEGSGMGLAIVEKILTRYGGKIELESKVGEGSCFSLHWPKNIERRK